MNVADLQRVGSALEHLGYAMTEQAADADVIVMNTCVVRQSAEDKVRTFQFLQATQGEEPGPGY